MKDENGLWFCRFLVEKVLIMCLAVCAQILARAKSICEFLKKPQSTFCKLLDPWTIRELVVEYC